MLTAEQGDCLLKLARESVVCVFHGEKQDVREQGLWLKQKKGLFVTLQKHGLLRGCIGFIDACYTLEKGVVKAAAFAAFDDPRFPPLEPDELKDISFEVSVLSAPVAIRHKTPEDLIKKIVPEKDGLVLELNGLRGLFLPQVWSQIKDKEEFLGELCFKAGIPDPQAWKKRDAKIWRFSVQVFAEHGIIL